MMGGDISVESELGRGSKFVINLPVHVVDAETQARLPRRRGRGFTGSFQQAPLILVVDDDPDRSARSSDVTFYAKDLRLPKRMAGGKASGWRANLNPAAITLDITMPDLDGWTVLAAIKGDPALANIPVILLTILDEKARLCAGRERISR